jgi:alpha-glucosidase (family GH31 glycosyl hydrolase)
MTTKTSILRGHQALLPHYASGLLNFEFYWAYKQNVAQLPVSQMPVKVFYLSLNYNIENF